MVAHLYIALYKPYGHLSQFTGNEKQRTLKEFKLPKDIYAAGRLDKDSEGLLILTNDGPFIKKFLDPDNGHKRTYLVQVEGIPNDLMIKKLENGVTIKGHRTKPAKVKKLKREPCVPERTPPIRMRKNIPTSWLKITLTEGKNRQVRRMTAHIGHPTLRLIRIKMGKLELQQLAPGEWRKIDRQMVI